MSGPAAGRDGRFGGDVPAAVAAAAFLILGLYAAACLAIPALLTWRRDIA